MTHCDATTVCHFWKLRVQRVPEVRKYRAQGRGLVTWAASNRSRRCSSPSPRTPAGNAERQAVEFGVEIGEYRGVVRVPRRVFQRLLPERPAPERCVEAYYLKRTRFESIAERKLRRRQLTEDGNVEISGRDLRYVANAAIGSWPPNGSIRPKAPIRLKVAAWAARAKADVSCAAPTLVEPTTTCAYFPSARGCQGLAIPLDRHRTQTSSILCVEADEHCARAVS
jgi:hypothetical protein